MTARMYTTDELKNSKWEMLTLKRCWHQKQKTRKVIVWECACDCGNTTYRRESSIITGNAVSCGCDLKRQSGLGKNSKNWKGVGDIGLWYFNMMKSRCEKANRRFDVTLEMLWGLFLKQDKKCALTGLPIGFATRKERTVLKQANTASVDRIDSTKGYTADNVQWLHKDVNIMKNDFPLERFIEICHLVAERFPRPIGPSGPCRLNPASGSPRPDSIPESCPEQLAP